MYSPPLLVTYFPVSMLSWSLQQPVGTSKQMKEESLCLCYLYDVFIIWLLLLAHLLLIESAQALEGVPHPNGVAENQAVVVLSQVVRTRSHFLILFCRSFIETKTSFYGLLDQWQGSGRNWKGHLPFRSIWITHSSYFWEPSSQVGCSWACSWMTCMIFLMRSPKGSWKAFPPTTNTVKYTCL